MSDVAVDELLRSFDAFVETVFWTEEKITLEEALTQAVEDWVAMAAAEHNESKPFREPHDGEGLGAVLVQMATAVELFAGLGSDVTMATALREAMSDWAADIR